MLWSAGTLRYGLVSGCFQELVWRDVGLLQDGAQSAFGQFARMVRKRGVAVRLSVVPNLVTAACLAVECEAKILQSPDDLALAKS